MFKKYMLFFIGNSVFQLSLSAAKLFHKLSFKCCLRVAYSTYNHPYTKTVLYLVYLDPCLGLDLFILYLCDPFFVFSLSSIAITNIASLKQSHFFFLNISCYFLMVILMKKANNFQIAKVQLQVVA